MRRVSLNARRSIDDATTDEMQAVLFHITHPSLDAPVRLTTDPTERLSDDPLMYGTRSTWADSNTVTEPFLFILASTVIPSDLDDAPASGTLIIENVDSGLSTLLRSFTTPAALKMAVVLARSPSTVEAEWRDLQISSADLADAEISLSFSRDDIEDEYSPGHTINRNWFPAIYS